LKKKELHFSQYLFSLLENVQVILEARDPLSPALPVDSSSNARVTSKMGSQSDSEANASKKISNRVF
jgi:hypothetical protein